MLVIIPHLRIGDKFLLWWVLLGTGLFVPYVSGPILGTVETTIKQTIICKGHTGIVPKAVTSEAGLEGQTTASEGETLHPIAVEGLERLFIAKGACPQS